MGIVMQVSFSASLDTERPQYAIGRVSAHTPWRAAELSQADREIAIRALVREAEEYGADGVVEIAFAVEACKGGECEGVKLHRLVATGRAVKLALAA
jgi:uncharacterized protein YbjQ (UPF0145 family)